MLSRDSAPPHIAANGALGLRLVKSYPPCAQDRLTCKEAMAHAYFAPVREAEAQRPSEGATDMEESTALSTE